VEKLGGRFTAAPGGEQQRVATPQAARGLGSPTLHTLQDPILLLLLGFLSMAHLRAAFQARRWVGWRSLFRDTPTRLRTLASVVSASPSLSPPS
jgi:hypothetical protein